MSLSPCTAEAVLRRCQLIGFNLAEKEAGQLAEYLGLLMKWNKVMNLVGADSWESCLEKLVSDSLHLASYLKRRKDILFKSLSNAAQIWDLGSGAGLPGIPLRILWQEGEYWLVEAREKRALFPATVLSRLMLPHTQAFHGRVENFMTERMADLVLSRAFMPWEDILTLLNGKIREGGHVLFMINSPLSESFIPDGWCLKDVHAYKAGRGTRYFCSVAVLPNKAPS